jgi:hypothetical protein
MMLRPIALGLVAAACARSPGPGVPVATVPCCASTLVADSTALYAAYFQYSGGSRAGDVYRVDADGGPASLFAHFPFSQGTFAATGGAVFEADSAPDGGIFEATPGEAPKLMATTHQADVIGADRDRVYWTELDSALSPVRRVRAASLDGGAPVEIAQGDEAALGGDAVWFVSGASLMRVPKSDLTTIAEVARSTAPPDYASFPSLGAGETAAAWWSWSGDVLLSAAGAAPVRAGSSRIPASPFAIAGDRIYFRTIEFTSEPQEDAVVLPPIRHRVFRLQGGRLSQVAEGITPTQLDGSMALFQGDPFWMLEWMLENAIYRIE